jgi:nucleoside-diphosphate-sugar epimerase
VVQALAHARTRPIELEQDPALVRKVERENLQADISRLEATLGWRPSRNLETMLAYAAKDEE